MNNIDNREITDGSTVPSDPDKTKKLFDGHDEPKLNTIDKTDTNTGGGSAIPFDADKTKKLLQRQEKKMGKIMKGQVELVDATATIFLKALIGSVSTTNNNDSPKNVVTLDKIRAAIVFNSSFEFLKDAMIDIKDEPQQPVEYRPTKKTKRAVSEKKSDARNMKKVKSALQGHGETEVNDVTAVILKADTNAATSRTTAVAPSDQIVPDEDDYD